MPRNATTIAATLAIVVPQLIAVLPAEAAEVGKPVTTKRLEELTFFPSIDSPAIVVSLNDAKVSAQAPGVIKSFAAAVGDRVEAGATIASLNCEEHDIGVNIAEANLEAAQSKQAFAKSQLASAKKLSASKGIAKERVDERQSEFAVASAEIDRAKAALKDAQRLADHCQIVAPFDGTVVEHLVSTGDYANKGIPVARLVDTKNIEISAHVQEQDVPSLSEAMDLVFSNRGTTFPVKVRTVLPLMDSRLRSFEVRLSFVATRPSPGTTGRLHWKLPKPHISPEYLVKRADNFGIFLFEDGNARYHAISGAQPGKPALVHLAPDTRVIVEGRHGLEDGELTRVAGQQQSE